MGNIKIKRPGDLKKIKENFTGHTKTILKHKKEVLKNCFKCGLFVQGITHDMSKFSPTEFIPGVMHFQGDRSPNEGERDDYGYSKAWMHHKGRNKHHFEYWTDYNKQTRKLMPVRMPKRYVVEMFCDRVAASKIYHKESYTDRTALDYYIHGKSKVMLHPYVRKKLEMLLTMLAEKGEEYTFNYCKAYMKAYRKYEKKLEKKRTAKKRKG